MTGLLPVITHYRPPRKRRHRHCLCLRFCLPLALLISSTCKAATTDTAGIYSPVLPHRLISKSPCYPYPYLSDYDVRVDGQVRASSGQLISASPPEISQQPPQRDSSVPARNSAPPPPPPSNSNFPRYPYPYQYQRPSASSGFHAVNQLEFIDPIGSPNGNLQPGRRTARPRRPRPRPTCTIMGPGGGGSSSGI